MYVQAYLKTNKIKYLSIKKFGRIELLEIKKILIIEASGHYSEINLIERNVKQKIFNSNNHYLRKYSTPIQSKNILKIIYIELRTQNTKNLYWLTQFIKFTVKQKTISPAHK